MRNGSSSRVHHRAEAQSDVTVGWFTDLDGVPFCRGLPLPGTPMKEFKDLWKAYSKYFVDVWQYLVVIVVFIIGAIIFL